MTSALGSLKLSFLSHRAFMGVLAALVLSLGLMFQGITPAHATTTGIKITKFTNGQDANTAPGPQISQCGEVLWTYEVKLFAPQATGPLAPLTIQVVKDDAGDGPGGAKGDFSPPRVNVGTSDDGDALLEEGETWYYAKSGGTPVLGQYRNLAYVRGTAPDGVNYSSSDPSHYFGIPCLIIDIEKFTNGQDVTSAPGPEVKICERVSWTYQVKLGVGSDPMANVVVVDDNGTPGIPGDDFTPVYVSGDDGDNVLEQGEVWLYDTPADRADDSPVLGQYGNVAKVTGTSLNGLYSDDDSDASYYHGVECHAGGGEGCTPGYWKQPHHFDSWPAAYSPGDTYDATFGVTSSFGAGFTLLQALGQGGGEEIALGRHAVAALLNADSSGVSYEFTAAEVIALVQAAYAPGDPDFEAVHIQLATENERECLLN